MAIDIAALFRMHGKELQGFLRKRGASPELAADLSQEAFMRLLTAPADTNVKSATAYLFRTATNLSIDWGRRQRLLQMASDQEAALLSVADETPSAERVIISRQELAVLQAALNELPPAIRFVFYARLEGMTFAAIGRKLGLSQNTVFSQMARVMILLKRSLDHARGEAARDPGQVSMDSKKAVR